MNTQPSLFWTEADLISVYTRQQAIADGFLIDASTGELGEVSRQYYKYPVAMTAAVWAVIDKAVRNPNSWNDLKGVWHNVLYMSQHYVVRHLDVSIVLFEVKIVGAGRKQIFTFKMMCGSGDNAEPVMTVMLPDED